MAPGRQPTLRLLPLGRVVKWLPLDGPSANGPALASFRAEPLVVLQDVLLDVEAHLRTSAGPDAFGLLLGAPYVCPESQQRYLLIERVVNAPPPPPPTSSGGAMTDAEVANSLRELARAGSELGYLVVGWYRSGTSLDTGVSAADAAIHRTLFPEPWQVALLRDGIGPLTRGAFVRIEPTDGRAYSVPFYELFPPPPEHGAALHGASVTWANYRVDAMTAPVETPAIPPVSPAAAPSPGNTNPRAPFTLSDRAGIGIGTHAGAGTEAGMGMGNPGGAARAKAPPSVLSSNGNAPERAAPFRENEIDRLFAQPEAGGESTEAAPDAPDASPPPQRHDPVPNYLYGRPRPYWRRPFFRRAAVLVILAAAAAYGAARVRSVRSEQQAQSEAGEVEHPLGAPRLPAFADPAGADSLAPHGARGASAGGTAILRDDNGDPTAVARFAQLRIDEARSALQQKIADFSSTLIATSDPAHRLVACARADSLYIQAMVNLDAANLARRQLSQNADTAALTTIHSLSGQVDAMPKALRTACR